MVYIRDTIQNNLVVVFGLVFRKLFLWEPKTFVWRELKIVCSSFATEWAGEPGTLHGIPGFWGGHLLPNSFLPPPRKLCRSLVVILTCCILPLQGAFLIRVRCFLKGWEHDKKSLLNHVLLWTNKVLTVSSLLLEEFSSVLTVRSPWRLNLTDGIPVSCSGSGSSVKVTLTLLDERRIKMILVEERSSVKVTVVEERRRSSNNCISLRFSVGKTATWSSHSSVLPISYHIKGLPLNVRWQSWQ